MLFGQRSVIEILVMSVSVHFNYENKALLLDRYCSKMDQKYLDYLQGRDQVLRIWLIFPCEDKAFYIISKLNILIQLQNEDVLFLNS